MRPTIALACTLTLLLPALSCGGEEATGTQTAAPKSAAQTIRETEVARITALTMEDIDRARSLHADDFHLTAPNGEEFTKDEYLDLVGSGRLDYLLWKPISPLEVKKEGDTANVTYRSEIGFAGNFGGTTEQTHNDAYELRSGRWVIVRSVTVSD
jgi:Domain of unknown function (DUF4440)